MVRGAPCKPRALCQRGLWLARGQQSRHRRRQLGGLPGLLPHGCAAGVYATFEGGGGRLAAVNGQLCFGC